MAKQNTGVKWAAELLGATPKWVRARIAEGAISPKRAHGGRRGPYIITDDEVEVLKRIAASPTGSAADDTLARVTRLEAERANLLARLAWEHATAEARQKTLDEERHRVESLTAEVATQRTRVEQLKALSAWDRLLGRHKGV